MENRLKYHTLLIVFFLGVSLNGFSQEENKSIAAGNELYKQGQFDKAVEAYQKALDINPNNQIARYNLAAAKYRLQKFEEAQKDYTLSAEKSTDPSLKSKSVYNEGVALTKQKKLLESIASYKQALRLNPNDADTRFNLQKALEELRKQQKQKEPEKKKDQEQKKDQKKEQKPPPANKKQIEQWLQSLKQKEQEVQQKMQQQKRRSTSQPDKDW